jgi:hypothetical protein
MNGHFKPLGTMGSWTVCNLKVTVHHPAIVHLKSSGTTGMRASRQLKCDGTRTETRFRLSAKRTSPFKSAGASVQSTTGSRGVCISGSTLDTPCSEVVRRVLATHSIRHFPLHFPSCASPCAITFQLDSTTTVVKRMQFWPTVLYICCATTLQHTANKVQIKYKGKLYTNRKKCKKNEDPTVCRCSQS